MTPSWGKETITYDLHSFNCYLYENLDLIIIFFNSIIDMFTQHIINQCTPLGTDHLTWRGGVWFFVSFRIFFSDNTRVRIFFFCRAEREIFFQNLTLDFMTKILNQIIFFFLHQNQNIFFSNIGNQNIFLEKNHNPPFKLNGRSLIQFEIWENTS